MNRSIMLIAVLFMSMGCNYNQNIPDNDGNSGRGSSGPSASTPTGASNAGATTEMNGSSAGAPEAQASGSKEKK